MTIVLINNITNERQMKDLKRNVQKQNFKDTVKVSRKEA